MTDILQKTDRQTKITRLSTVTALLVGMAYWAIAAGVLPTGLSTAEAPVAIPIVAGGCYVVGGLLIGLRKRGLLLTGAIVNTLVMGFFLSAYTNRPEVMFSAGGLLTKSLQLLLEIGLIYLLTVDRKARRDVR